MRRPVRSTAGSCGVVRSEGDCCLRDLDFLGLVVLITFVETVDNRPLPRGSAVNACSRHVGSLGFKQGVDVDNPQGPF